MRPRPCQVVHKLSRVEHLSGKERENPQLLAKKVHSIREEVLIQVQEAGGGEAIAHRGPVRDESTGL